MVHTVSGERHHLRELRTHPILSPGVFAPAGELKTFMLTDGINRGETMDLDGMSHNDLRAMAKELGVSASGSSEKLRERILNAMIEDGPEGAPEPSVRAEIQPGGTVHLTRRERRAAAFAAAGVAPREDPKATRGDGRDASEYIDSHAPRKPHFGRWQDQRGG
jgi:hypothetical protein